MKQIFNDYVLITPIVTKKVIGTSGLEGITTNEDKYRRGKVEYSALPQLEKGDTVIYDKQSINVLEDGDIEYEVITSRDIIASI